jgi:hypothetical protein
MAQQQVQVPEWEGTAHTAHGTSKGAFFTKRPFTSSSSAPVIGKDELPGPMVGHRTGSTFRDRFDTILPPGRKYMRLSRRNFLFVLLGLLLLLILVIGLAAGLSGKKSS